MGLTLLPRGLTLFANGCRYFTLHGELIEKHCDDCLRLQGRTCALEPCARELAWCEGTAAQGNVIRH